MQVCCSKSAAGLVAPDEGNVWPKGDPWCRRRDGLGWRNAGNGRVSLAKRERQRRTDRDIITETEIETDRHRDRQRECCR